MFYRGAYEKYKKVGWGMLDDFSWGMLVNLIKAKALTTARGQEYVVFIHDQQLYRVALQIIWNCLPSFSQYYLRLGVITGCKQATLQRSI